MIQDAVKINGYWYNLASEVMGTYHSRLPGKVNIGSDSFDTEQFLSSWIISDQRGGIGIDEMDEKVHADRCWWTNCIIDEDGHIVSPRLASSLSPLTLTSPTTVDAVAEWTGEDNAKDTDDATKATQTSAGAGGGGKPI